MSTKTRICFRAARPGRDGDGCRQVSVAVENARLFAEEQRRSRQLAFSQQYFRAPQTSSDDPVHMLGQIVGEIQKNFSFDHIGIGLLDYGTRRSKSKAEAGATAHRHGQADSARHWHPGARRLGRGTGAGANGVEGQIGAILPESRSVLCIPSHTAKLCWCGDMLRAATKAHFFRRTFSFSTRCRSAGHSFAQRFRLPEAAAAIDHRWPGLESKPGAFSGKHCRPSGARFALGETVLRGTDRPGQIQGSE